MAESLRERAARVLELVKARGEIVNADGLNLFFPSADNSGGLTAFDLITIACELLERNSHIDNSPPAPEEWVWSTNDEHFNSGKFESREAAIEDAKAESGAPYVYVGKAIEPQPPGDLWDCEDWMEHVSCQDAYSIEAAEGWNDGVSKSDSEHLNCVVRTLLNHWCAVTIGKNRFYLVDEIEKVRLSDGEADNVANG